MLSTNRLVSEHEMFVREFLELYKQHPLLWQQSHPLYRNQAERRKAYKILINKAQEYYPEADDDFVRMKIDSMRAAFRKERRKVLASKENCDNEIYKPSLWYYGLLLFTVGEENEEEEDVTEDRDKIIVSVEKQDHTSVRIPFWSREYSALLINLYKSHPSLYSENHPKYKCQRERNRTFKEITNKLIETTGKQFFVDDVKKKTYLLRNQFLYELRKVKRSQHQNRVYKPTLWCFEMLKFLKDHNKSGFLRNRDTNIPQRIQIRRKRITSECLNNNMDIKKESDTTQSSEEANEEEGTIEDEDIFDTIAKNLAYKLREMTEEQRSIANKIIRDVMYHGQMEHLSDNSRLSLDGT